jgi:glycolate oxidase FAD binding subunit
MADLTPLIQERIREAYGQRKPLEIVGGGSKRFYGRLPEGQVLDLSGHGGIIAYEPAELMLMARSGTPLVEIEAALAESGQMLAFEPPRFAAAATLGGTVACGLSGPRRPYVGAVRDHVLGVKCINGKGELLSFGGQVVKNVAGFDLFRLMAGALGTLGVLLELSVKVMPVAHAEQTLSLDVPAAMAIGVMNEWAGQPLPLSAACHDGERLFVRLSGASTAVEAARRCIGGEQCADGNAFWESVRELRHPFFGASPLPLWRLSVPSAAPPLPLAEACLLDWGGAQRWITSAEPAASIRQAAAAVGGHATLFRGGDRTGEVFHPLPDGLSEMHRRLKLAFDPERILNRGRLFRDL